MDYQGSKAPLKSGDMQNRPLRLLDEVRNRLRLKHYSLRTEKVYVYWIRRYILENGKTHPRELGGLAVEAFLSRLATKDQVSASTQNQALSALLFLYREVLSIDLPWMENVVRAKQSRKLPVVLSKSQTVLLLSKMSGRDWLAASLLYGAGLRLMEAMRLRVKDLNFERNEITVRDGKGGKDRKTVLPFSLKPHLQRQVEQARALHAKDLAEGYGAVSLPVRVGPQIPACGNRFRLAIRVPRLAPRHRSVRWPREASPHRRKSPATCRPQCRTTGRPASAGVAAHPAPLLRHPPAGIRLRHPHRAGIARPPGRDHHPDLHACAQPRRRRCAQSDRPHLAPAPDSL